MFVSLVVLQACLGASAKNDERNVVQVTTENDEGESVTHTILSMRVGGTEQVCIVFVDSFYIRLASLTENLPHVFGILKLAKRNIVSQLTSLVFQV